MVLFFYKFFQLEQTTILHTKIIKYCIVLWLIMVITIEGIMLFISWVILFIGIVLLIFIPKLIYNYIKCKETTTHKPTYRDRDRKLKDRQILLDYYIVAGITITIIGFLLVLIFSNNLVLPKF